VRPLLERRHLPVAHLVQDPARILVAEIVQADALPVAERAQRGRRELGGERKRLQARENAVATEHGHEPWETCCRKTAPARDEGREAQRREIDEATPVGRLQRILVAFDARRVVDPALQVAPHTQPRALRALHLLARCWISERHRDDIELGAPLVVGLDPDLEGEAVLVQPGRRRSGDLGRAAEGPTVVGEDELSGRDPRRVGSLLLERVFDLEQVGEIGARLETDAQVDRLVGMVENRQLLVEAVGDRSLADHGQLRVDVDGASAGDEEEACLEVLKVVDRERIHPLPIERQHPLREKARVE
jgi:hypothetical protein